jgi:hypothetical protein
MASLAATILTHPKFHSIASLLLVYPLNWSLTLNGLLHCTSYLICSIYFHICTMMYHFFITPVCFDRACQACRPVLPKAPRLRTGRGLHHHAQASLHWARYTVRQHVGAKTVLVPTRGWQLLAAHIMALFGELQQACVLLYGWFLTPCVRISGCY